MANRMREWKWLISSLKTRIEINYKFVPSSGWNGSSSNRHHCPIDVHRMLTMSNDGTFNSISVSENHSICHFEEEMNGLNWNAIIVLFYLFTFWRIAKTIQLPTKISFLSICIVLNSITSIVFLIRSWSPCKMCFEVRLLAVPVIFDIEGTTL